ncbi:MAG: hypothetical protein ACTSWW_06390 [Promethearchaeota archaeon]
MHIAVAELNSTHQDFTSRPRIIRKNSDIPPDLRRAMRRPTLISWSEIKEKQGQVEISRYSSVAELCPSISKRAQKLYRQAILSPYFTKKRTLLIARVCIFHALRENQFPITLNEILKDTNFHTALAIKYYALFRQVCNLPKLSLSPTDFIPMIASKLALSPDVVQKAIEIIHDYQKTNSASVTARSVVAGALFLACGVLHYPCSRGKICSLLALSPCTLRTRLKQMQRIIPY